MDSYAFKYKGRKYTIRRSSNEVAVFLAEADTSVGDDLDVAMYEIFRLAKENADLNEVLSGVESAENDKLRKDRDKDTGDLAAKCARLEAEKGRLCEENQALRRASNKTESLLGNYTIESLLDTVHGLTRQINAHPNTAMEREIAELKGEAVAAEIDRDRSRTITEYVNSELRKALEQRLGHVEELSSLAQSQWERLKKRKRKIKKLRDQRDNWKRSAEWDSEQRDLANARCDVLEDEVKKLREEISRLEEGFYE